MVARRPSTCLPPVSLIKVIWLTRATIKAHSTHPLRTRPYGQCGFLPLFMSSVDAYSPQLIGGLQAA